VIHDLESLSQKLRGARDRLKKGIVPSEEIKKRVGDPNVQPHGTVRLEAHADPNPIRPAEQRYVQSMAQWHTTSCLHACLTHCFHASESTTADILAEKVGEICSG
jgi:hypothetical protein